MQPFEGPSVRYWSKEINGALTGGRKSKYNSRADDASTVHGARAGLILSIPVKHVSLWSPGVDTIHVQAPTPHAPALQAFSTEFSQHYAALYVAGGAFREARGYVPGPLL
jgi:hypothetical protein